MLFSCRSILGVMCFLVLILLPAMPARAADEPAEIPAHLRGTWSLRLTSDDGGKTYLSGGSQPICEVIAGEITFVRKFDHADEKLTVKGVKSKTEENGAITHRVTFTNGKIWDVWTLSGSITSIMYDVEGEKLTEKYRIVTRILK